MFYHLSDRRIAGVLLLAVVDGVRAQQQLQATTLRLHTTPIGMKQVERIEDMEAIPRIRRPRHVHATGQIVGQAARNGWTVDINADDLVGAQCATVVVPGLAVPHCGTCSSIQACCTGWRCPSTSSERRH